VFATLQNEAIMKLNIN